MNWFLRLSIKNKLTVIILSVTLFAIGLGCTGMLLLELSHRKQEISDNALLIAQTTGAYIAEDVASQNKPAVQQALNILAGNPDIINIFIYGPNGQYFTSLHESANTPSVAPAEHTVSITDSGVYVAEPLEFEGHHYGTIYQIMSIAPIQQEKFQHIVAAIILIVMVLLFSFLITNRLQGLISKPIMNLTDVAKQIKQERSYNLRAKTELKDEIGALYTMFNQMMERIEQHEAELRLADEKWRAITGNTPDIIMLVDEEGRIQFINQTLPEFTSEEVIGRFVTDFVPDRFRQTIEKTFEAVWRTGLTQDFEVEYESPRGVIVYESRVGPIKNSKIAGLSVSSRNISQRKSAEAAKARALKRLAILRSLDEAILKAHSSTAIAAAALENINGLVPTRRSSVTLFDIPNHEMVVLASCGTVIDALAIGARLALDSAWGDIEALKNGKVHTVDDIGTLAQVSPVARSFSQSGIKAFHNIPLRANGELIGTLNLCAATAEAFSLEELDITTEIAGVLAIAIEQARLKEAIQHHGEQMERRVAERTAELEAANRELESFSYSVSHDLRAPLRSIDGFSRLILDEYQDVLDQQGVDYLNRVRNASQRMGRLIDDLLALSRINRSGINRKLVSVGQLAREVMNALREHEPQRQVEFIVHGDINAFADSQLLRVVLENLLGNAWKFTSHKPQAVIEMGEDQAPGRHGGKRTIYVKDNGAGFDMNYAGKLFGAFQRLHSEEEFGGTGIGLASAQRIIHRHGGEIWAEGKVEKGAVFYFTLGP